MRFRRFQFLILCVAILMLVACSDGGEGDAAEDDPDETAEVAGDDDADDDEAAADDEADDADEAEGDDDGDEADEADEGDEPDEDAGDGQGGGDVTVQLYQQPTTFYPVVASIGPNHMIGQLHWDSLVAVDTDNEYMPRLAEDWEVSEDGTEWTFHLRDDVSWSDGEPFTAADVLFTFELYANPESASANVGKFANVEGGPEFAEGEADSVEGFATPDDHTFTISLVEPNSAYLIEFVQPLLYILPEHIVSEFEVATLEDNQFFREPTVGIGPFVFEQWVTDDQIEFHANPEYHTQPDIERVFAQHLATDVAAAQLETGEMDYAQVAAADAERVDGLDGVTLHRTEGPGIMALHSALDSGKLDDPRVRQAVLHAIDRESLVDQVLAGEGMVVDTMIHGPDWAVPDDLTHYEYDPDRARELLEEAEWDESTPVRIEIIPGQSDRDLTVTIVAGQLQEVGIDAMVTQQEAAEQSEAIADRDFDMLISSYGLFNLDPAAMDARLTCGQVGGGNLVAYCNPELDELLEAGVATPDEDERAEIYAEAQRIVNEEVPVFVLYSPNTLAATSDRIEGFELNAGVTMPFLEIAEWSVSD